MNQSAINLQSRLRVCVFMRETWWLSNHWSVSTNYWMPYKQLNDSLSQVELLSLWKLKAKLRDEFEKFHLWIQIDQWGARRAPYFWKWGPFRHNGNYSFWVISNAHALSINFSYSSLKNDAVFLNYIVYIILFWNFLRK